MLAELVLIHAGRKPEMPHHLDLKTLRRVITDRNMIVLSLMYFTQAYGFYFNITWLPTYLNRARGFSSIHLGVLAGLPLLLSAAADLVGGVATDRVVRAFGLRVGRCGIGAVSLLIAGMALLRRRRGL